jgi:hypothetical protein
MMKQGVKPIATTQTAVLVHEVQPAPPLAVLIGEPQERFDRRGIRVRDRGSECRAEGLIVLHASSIGGGPFAPRTKNLSRWPRESGASAEANGSED